MYVTRLGARKNVAVGLQAVMKRYGLDRQAIAKEAVRRDTAVSSSDTGELPIDMYQGSPPI